MITPTWPIITPKMAKLGPDNNFTAHIYIYIYIYIHIPSRPTLLQKNFSKQMFWHN